MTATSFLMADSNLYECQPPLFQAKAPLFFSCENSDGGCFAGQFQTTCLGFRTHYKGLCSARRRILTQVIENDDT
jgi:hypothetical protein